MSRGWLAATGVMVVAMGLLSRWDAVPLPGFLRSHAGDALWATLVTLGLAFLQPAGKPVVLAAVALGIAFGVEFSQLYRAPWIDSLRNTVPGHLILGQGFLWADLPRYAVGVLLGYAVLRLVPRRDG